MAKARPKTPKLGDLKAAPYNPREIEGPALDGLKTSLGEFGDISGICWNQRTGHLVTGHQRMKSLREAHGDELRMKAGQLHVPGGEVFRVRVVDWPIAKEKAANVAANSQLLSGVFTDDLVELLQDVDQALPELSSQLLLDQLLDAAEQAPAEFPDLDEDLETEHQCPKCSYRWSGKSR